MKVYVEIPLSGRAREMTKEELDEFASFLESAMDSYGCVSGEYNGRTIGEVRVYRSLPELMMDRGEA